MEWNLALDMVYVQMVLKTPAQVCGSVWYDAKGAVGKWGHLGGLSSVRDGTEWVSAINPRIPIDVPGTTTPLTEPGRAMDYPNR